MEKCLSLLDKVKKNQDWNDIIELYQLIGKLPSIGDIKYPITGVSGIYTNIRYAIPNKEKTIFAIEEFLKFYNNYQL